MKKLLSSVVLILALSVAPVLALEKPPCKPCPSVSHKRVIKKKVEVKQKTKLTIAEFEQLVKVVKPEQNIVVNPTPITFTSPTPIYIPQLAPPQVEYVVPVKVNDVLLSQLLDEEKEQTRIAKSSLKWQKVGTVANVATAVFTGITAFRVGGDRDQSVHMIQTVSASGGTSSANGGSSSAGIFNSGNSSSNSNSESRSSSDSNASSSSNSESRSNSTTNNPKPKPQPKPPKDCKKLDDKPKS